MYTLCLLYLSHSVSLRWRLCNVVYLPLYPKQSGCAEILDKCIKTDYWDIHAMADAIYSICTYPAMYEYLKEEGKKEVDEIKWENVGYKVRGIYDEVIKNYGKQ